MIIHTQPDTLTTREAAKLLGASVRTIQLWVEGDRLKAWKTPGGHRRVLRTSVEEMLAKRQRMSGGNPRKYEVLLIDNDPGQIATMEKALSKLGPDTHLRAADDGYEALIRVGETHPDLLVIDLAMPGPDGYRLLKTLAREAATQPMRIIVLTALTQEEMAAQGGFPEGVTLLHKPLRVASLLSLAMTYHLAWQTRGS